MDPTGYNPEMMGDVDEKNKDELWRPHGENVKFRNYDGVFGLGQLSHLSQNSLKIRWMWVKMEDLGDHRC